MKFKIQTIIDRRILALTALAGAMLFFIYDLVTDWFHEEEYGIIHFALESVVFAGITIAFILGLRDLRQLRVRLVRERRLNRKLSAELADSINDQMDEWNLTRSERDVAWLIIKGYRFSEIAEARGVRENTTRLQATSIYSKAGVHGRAEFVAEIIQPLLISVQDDSSPRLEEANAEMGSS